MTRAGVASLGLAILLGATGVARAQSLGDVAKREEDKKKKAGKPPAAAPKVYTDEDLKKAREADSAAVTVLPENGNLQRSSSTSSGDSSEQSDATKNERYWRKQAAERREAVEEADKNVRDLQARLTALRNDLTPTNLMDPGRLQTQDRDIRQAEGELEAARRDAATARQRVADLEDEARRAGALPGWVR
jgi:hypothetical protein